MPDLAELGIRVTSGGSAEEIRKVDAGLRRLAESNNGWSDSLRKSILVGLQRQGQLVRFLEIEKQLRAEEEQQIRVEQQLAAAEAQRADAQARATESAEQANRAAIRLRSGFSSLAAQLTSINPTVAQLAGTLGQFTVGAGLTVGILAGVAAISFAYDKLTASARQAREDADKLTQSLLNQAKAEYEATTAGKAHVLQLAKENQEAARQEVGANAFAARGGAGPVAQALAYFRATDVAKRYGEAVAAVAVAERNLRDSQSTGGGSGSTVNDIIQAKAEAIRKQYEKDLADAKKTAEEKKQAEKKYYAELEDLRKFAQQQEEQAYKRSVQNYIEALKEMEEERKKRFVSLFGEGDIGKDSVKNLQRSGQFDNLVDENLLKRLNHHFGDLSDSASKAAKTISQALEYYLVNKLGGGGLGASFGASLAKGALGDYAGGFAKTALGSAIFSPIAAGIGAAFGGALDDIFDFSGAVEQARRALVELREQVERSLAVERAKASGGNVSLVEAETSVREFYANLRKQIEEVYRVRPANGGTGLDGKIDYEKARQADIAARKKALDELDALEQQRIEIERHYVTESQRLQRQDLEVRALVAQGKSKEAEQLRKQLDDQREILEAEKAGLGKDYIDRLKQVQALERNTKALDDLTNSLRNAPTGFKIESYINRFATPRGQPEFPPLPIPYSPERPTKGNVSSSIVINGGISLKIPDGMPPEKVGPAFMTFLTRVRSRTLGPNAPLADALEFA